MAWGRERQRKKELRTAIEQEQLSREEEEEFQAEIDLRYELADRWGE